MHSGLPNRKSGGGARRMLWARRTVFFDGVYPAVWWPEHPMARSNGHLRIHRAVAAKMLDRPLTPVEHVHHRNEDVWDWRRHNLAVLSNSEHGHEHSKGQVVAIPCSFCSEPFELSLGRLTKTARPCCSMACSARLSARGDWPSDAELEQLLYSNPITVVGVMIGVTDNAVRRYARRRGIPTPAHGRGYWT